jgi:isoleucyl-tRNA synthetase
VAETLVDACMERWGLQGQVLAVAQGEKLGGHRV